MTRFTSFVPSTTRFIWLSCFIFKICASSNTTEYVVWTSGVAKAPGMVNTWLNLVNLQSYFPAENVRWCTSLVVCYTAVFSVVTQRSSPLACVAWRFWLGALSNKGGRGQRNREFRGLAARAPGSTKPPCYTGYLPTSGRSIAWRHLKRLCSRPLV